MTVDPETVAIRDATVADVEAIMAIERHCFRAAWSAEQYERSLASEASFAVLAEDQGRPVGFAIANLVLDEAHIPTVGVVEAYRRLGIGRRLVTRLLAQVHQAGATCVFLEVRRLNRAARRLYEQLGFELLSIRRDYYWDPPDDGMVMRLSFDAPPPGDR